MFSNSPPPLLSIYCSIGNRQRNSCNDKGGLFILCLCIPIILVQHNMGWTYRRTQCYVVLFNMLTRKEADFCFSGFFIVEKANVIGVFVGVGHLSKSFLVIIVIALYVVLI